MITAVATHEGAKIMDPVTLDAEKTIRCWNRTFANEEDYFTDLSASGLEFELLTSQNNPNKTLNLLSGMSTGSSFVGMVHVLKSDSVKTNQTMLTTSMEAQMKFGTWFKAMEGGFGADSSFASDIKNLLSTQRISSHCSLTTMGIIPSIVSTEVEVAVRTFNDFDPAKTMDKLAMLENKTKEDSMNLQTCAKNARTGKAMVSLRPVRHV